MMSITELDHLGQLWITVAHILIINVGILLLLFFSLFVCFFLVEGNPLIDSSVQFQVYKDRNWFLIN